MISSFTHNAWSGRWHNVRYVLYALTKTLPGTYYRGHCGYKEEIDSVLDYSGISMIFVHRDLRDVAVSQAFHIMSDREDRRHPDKAAYRALGGFDEVLEAVIAGLTVADSQFGPIHYPGIAERWAMYAPWLNCEWVLPIKFRDARMDPEGTSVKMIRYGMRRLTQSLEVAPPEFPDHIVRALAKDMADSARDTKNSASFRRGLVGSWRGHFTERHKRVWLESGLEWN